MAKKGYIYKVAIISGEREQITQAIAYLSEKNVGVEVIKDARVSE